MEEEDEGLSLSPPWTVEQTALKSLVLNCSSFIRQSKPLLVFMRFRLKTAIVSSSGYPTPLRYLDLGVKVYGGRNVEMPYLSFVDGLSSVNGMLEVPLNWTVAKIVTCASLHLDPSNGSEICWCF